MNRDLNDICCNVNGKKFIGDFDVQKGILFGTYNNQRKQTKFTKKTDVVNFLLDHIDINKSFIYTSLSKKNILMFETLVPGWTHDTADVDGDFLATVYLCKETNNTYTIYWSTKSGTIGYGKSVIFDGLTDLNQIKNAFKLLFSNKRPIGKKDSFTYKSVNKQDMF